MEYMRRLPQRTTLTSTVFGLLKYIDSTVFWGQLLLRAISVGKDGRHIVGVLNLEALGGVHLSEIRFWQRYGTDIPDLTIRFFGQRDAALQLLVEVKLNAEKGAGGDPHLDQLVRYARLAQKLSDGGLQTLILFLTVGDPMPDMFESVRLLSSEPGPAERIFGLQWADVHATCINARDSMVPSKD